MSDPSSRWDRESRGGSAAELRAAALGHPYNITLQIHAFMGDRQHDREDLGHPAIVALLDYLVLVNRNFLRKYPNTPLLYKSGVRYEYETPGVEEWQDIPTTLLKGFGDCEDLACWRAAELIERYHVPAKPAFTFARMPNGGYLYHIRVWVPNGGKDGAGVMEDPSRFLGMT